MFRWWENRILKCPPESGPLYLARLYRGGALSSPFAAEPGSRAPAQCEMSQWGRDFHTMRCCGWPWDVQFRLSGLLEL